MSPYSGRTTLPPARTKTGHKFAWARLNADALFLSLYAIFVGVFAICWPNGDLVDFLGHASASHYLVNGGYAAGGAMIMTALIKQWVSVEIVGRVLLAWSTGFEVVRQTIAFGWYPEVVDTTIIFLIVTITGGLRLSVLLSKKGLVVRLPERTPTDTNNPEECP